ncbi:NYN domain-containing protein [Paenactinomyces guangxiensis]|uniref:NYN domain-containing protein n=1 Tax=Paenactinomyces guangxiensis TaxID=1490290 RepID=A0A7W1WTP0_9BACL|nr:NYN domain-containing protein [Paenactinomyces guangxiensis]MBA4495870.1 NYN domain-containing protein [Paenactinomyces guangxiensis]MBH8592993.1 NYN domain-containing protein [Paenactinomyces guangxiensis]
MVRQEEWLVVDGYNVIGAHSQVRWNPLSLEEERAKLIRDLSEYQAITGRRVFLVFDAHLSPGAQVKITQEKITVYYTRRDETADELIERFVKKHKSPHRHIYVATSDYLEQRMVFGQGAYRISSRELIQEIQTAKKKLSENLRKKENTGQRNTLIDRLSAEMQQKLEKWRRKK